MSKVAMMIEVLSVVEDSDSVLVTLLQWNSAIMAKWSYTLPFPSFEGPTTKANGLSENDISVRVNGDDATGIA